MSRVEVEGIFEEIDEQLEAENVAKFWLQHQNWIIGGLIALFVGLLVFVGWQEWQKKRDREVSDTYLSAIEALNRGDVEAGRNGLREVVRGYGDHGFAQMARFREAQALAGEGKGNDAALLLEEAAAMAVPPMKNMAIINASYVIADDDKLALRRLGNIPKESVFKPHALELAGVLTLKQGEAQAALGMFQEALTLKPDAGLRKRLEYRIQRLGG
ncbi:MAG: tetratricopeptide repeat protein [Magnetococcales bacterium]|nr:tetratricopeptide repeat protein [Magnetococcales bacterium]